MKAPIAVFCFCMAVWFIPQQAHATNGTMTGSGTAANPYLISDYADLCAISTYGITKVYRLANDIDASASKTANSGAGFAPIGTNSSASTYFSGSLHGGGHVISNLYVNRTTGYSGIFGAVYNSTIDSLGLVDVSISNTSYACPLVSYFYSGTINNCYATGSVSGTSYIGGLVAYNYDGVIKNSHSSCSSTGSLYVGGLTGYNCGTISYCYAKGSVTGKSFIGGLTGYNISGEINNSYYSGTVKGSYKYIGGLVGGLETSTINNCYAMGILSGKLTVGGLVGYSRTNLINYCYATNAVTADSDQVGGLIGYSLNDTIKYCYATGDVYSKNSDVGGFAGANVSITKDCYATSSVNGFYFVGGFNGYSTGKLYHSYSIGQVLSKNTCGGLTGHSITVSGCYWNMSTSGKTTGSATVYSATSFKAVGLTTTQLKNSSNLDSLNFTDSWKIRQDSTYPGLQGIDNAPFAFADVITVSKSALTTGISASLLLANDYDIETRQQSLILKIDSITGGRYDSGKLYFPDTAISGSCINILYRVGEIRSAIGDTLWGNKARSMVVMADLSDIADTTPEDTPIVVDISSVAQTYDGAITYSILTQPVNGTVSINEKNITYTPHSNFNGTDSISFTVSNQVNTSVGWIKLTVTKVNDAPILISVSDTTINEDIPLTLSIANVSATDIEGDALSLIIGKGDHYTVTANTITPQANYNGTLSIGISVTDGKDTSNVKTMTVTITPVNDAPILTSVSDTTISEDTPLTLSIANVTTTNVDGNPLSLVISKGDHYTVTANTITPIANYNGTLSIGISVTDGKDTSNVKTMTVTVTHRVSITTLNADNINLYPNPATTGFYANVGKSTTVIYIYDFHGRVVKSQQSIGLSYIDISGLDAGLYIVRIGNINSKLVKE